MEDLLDQYATYLRSWQARPTTIKARLTLARSRLLAWGVEGFTRGNIEQFLATDANGNERKKWTTSTYYNHLTDFCAFLVAAGRLETSPMDGVRRSKPPSKSPKPLTLSEQTRVLSVVEGEVRDWILIALLSGLRAFEIAKLRGEDFTSEGIYVVGKGDKEATIACHPDLAEMASRYPATGYWFPGGEDGHVRGQQISLTVGRLFRSLGISGSIHRCRHTYGTNLLRQGVNVRVLQRLMRHASLDTTAGYLAVVTDEERDAILKLSA
ncbi:integrase [Nocardioides sp. BE266]|uniref:tyrosine-type recombinase/integrase n=1 Tax=Nocardioides sp. BE266 TaxID=2817725 RepID=UPI00285A9E53|nr:site-specific integrase [Nocardioides sp. BE266]MDR7253683.1 integrase [Nocardioides sp. BE266]